MSVGEPLDFPVTSPGAVQTATEFEKLSHSMKRSAEDWNKVSQGGAKAAAGLGAMSAALGPLGAEFGVLGSAVSRSAGVITNMTALMGGPLGLALGVTAAGVGFLAKMWMDGSEESAKFSEELEKQATALRDVGAARATIMSENKKNKDEQQIQIDLSNGRATVEQYDAEIERLTKLAKVTNDAAEASKAFGRAMNLGILREGASKREQEQAAAGKSGSLALTDLEDSVAAQEGLIGANIPDGGKKRGGGKKKKEDVDLSALRAFDEATARTEERHEIELETERSFEAKKTEIAKIEADFRLEAEQEARAVRMQALEADVMKEQEAANARMQMHRDVLGVQKGAAADVTQIGIRTLNEAVKGSKISGKAVMQSIGDALVGRGTQAILEGTIFSATPFMWGSGAPMIAAGGVAIGAGMALGAASRAVGGGGGGGGGSGSTGTPQLGPASPVNTSGGSSNNRQPTTIIVNMSSVLAPTAEDGVRVTRAVEQAQREGRL